MTADDKRPPSAATAFRPPDRLYEPLRIGYGVVAIVEGADKFTNLLTDWTRYVPEGGLVSAVIPMGVRTMMVGVGVCEIAVGLAIVVGTAHMVKIAAYAMTAALVLIAGVAALAGFYDTAISDLLLAVGAYTLAGMAGLR